MNVQLGRVAVNIVVVTMMEVLFVPVIQGTHCQDCTAKVHNKIILAILAM